MSASSTCDCPALISRHPFGHLPDGAPVEAWTLANRAGFSLEVLTYGGIVTRLLAPGRGDSFADVVLGFDTLEPYLASDLRFGATIGRVAGRITGAAFTHDGRRYPLVANDRTNHLHGGRRGFDRRRWTATPVERADGAASLCLRLTSPDGEEGYPGEVEAAVTYTVTADNAFVFATEVNADRPTPVSLTHHSYFNLAGEGAGSVLDHEITVFAEAYAPTDKRKTLLGRAAVEGTAIDLRRPRLVSEVVAGSRGGHGDLYFLPDAGGEPRVAARVVHRESGRVLTVHTDEDCLQLYTGGALNASMRGKSGRSYAPYGGLCLECEGYPDAMNAPDLGDILVRPGQPRRSTTTYAFSALTG